MSFSIRIKDLPGLGLIFAWFVGEAIASTDKSTDNRIIYKCGAFGCTFATFDAEQAEAHKKAGKHGGTREPD